MISDERPPNPARVDVVLLTWNQREDTLECLRSLARMSYRSYRVLIVDNGSSDGTAEAIRREFPRIEVLRSEMNLGFSGGFNAGLRHALEDGAEYLLVLNNDTVVAPNLLDELMAHSAASDVGMLAPKIYYSNDPGRIWSVGGRRSWWNYEMIDTGNGQHDRGQWEQVLERDYLVGCAILLKRELLEQVGLFDERFSPIYYEDVDLCLRARSAGFRLLLVPSAKLWHKVASSGGGVGSPRERYLMARNSVLLFRKHVRGWRWLIVFPYRFGSAIKTSLRLVLAGRFRSLIAYWKGVADGLQSEPPS